MVVSTPFNTDDQTIIEAVKQRSRWIYKRLQSSVNKLDLSRLANIKVVKPLFLGKQYQLKVIHDDTKPKGVKLLEEDWK